jgi:hypothetical protein
MKIHKFLLTGTFLIFGIIACQDEKETTANEKSSEADNASSLSQTASKDESDDFFVDTTKFYRPQEFAGMNFLDTASTWCFQRSQQSDHFFVFWGKGYGEYNPDSSAVPEAYRVDIDDLLEKAESFYDMNINTLKFADVGVGKSNLDKYKMQIYLFYQTDWQATGSGYDDMIGVLWVSPATCKPVGAIIAHEIGHSFQFQVYADLLSTGEITNDYSRGFRYGFGGNGGNAFWEQCAQWQSFQSYPSEAFETYNFGVYMDNYHRHFCHESQRYASYWLHYYWTDKHGIDLIGKLWREAESPEDPIEAYMRIYDLSMDEMNAELYEAATHLATWDFDAIRSNGSNYIGQFSYKFYKISDGSYQVAYSKCPGTTGFNVVPLNVPDAGTVVTTTFTGLAPGSALASDDPGEYTDEETAYTTTNYNNNSLSGAGWRYGYVALLEDGQRVYGDMNSETSDNVEFTIPNGCKKLWFVVLGAPSGYESHAWDEKESNDNQWPYKIKFANTDLLGHISFDGTETPQDLDLSYNVDFAASSSEYSGTSITIEGSKLVSLAKSFVLQPAEISSKMDNGIIFYGMEPDGTLNSNTTANGYGHWFNANGNVCDWGSDAKVFSEFDASKFSFSVGQYPGHCSAGDKYTIRQALVYTYGTGKTVQATFSFNITIK